MCFIHDCAIHHILTRGNRKTNILSKVLPVKHGKHFGALIVLVHIRNIGLIVVAHFTVRTNDGNAQGQFELFLNDLPQTGRSIIGGLIFRPFFPQPDSRKLQGIPEALAEGHMNFIERYACRNAHGYQ